MLNQQTIQGNWNEIKGKLRSRWGALTDDDLMSFNGNVQQLIGTIQQKTGEARESVEHFVEQLTSESAAALHRGYDEIEDVVRQRPGKSLLVSFGAGLITGLVVALFLRRK